jgi:hypothetical protein
LPIEDDVQVVKTDNGVKINFVSLVKGSLDGHFYDVFSFVLSEVSEEGEVVGELGFEEWHLLLVDFFKLPAEEVLFEAPNLTILQAHTSSFPLCIINHADLPNYTAPSDFISLFILPCYREFPSFH